MANVCWFPTSSGQLRLSQGRYPMSRSSVLLKQAVRGNDNQSFEEAFANLAHSYITDRAPQLLDHALGFQLLDKNEDNNRAVGVFGFQVGKQILLSPMFFLNGQLKGYELLYVKNTDTFLPLKDGWVNYLLNRKPDSLGRSVTKNTRILGTEYPSLSAFSEVPGKYASSLPSWASETVPSMLAALRRYAAPEPMTPRLVKTSASCALRLLQLVNSYPQTARPIIECFGPELLKSAMQTIKRASSIATSSLRPALQGSIASALHARTETPHNSQLRIHVYNGQPVDGLSTKEAEDLKRDGFVIHDTRPQHSRIFSVQQPIKLFSPSETGIYEILTRPNGFARCAVLMGTVGGCGEQRDALVVQLDDRKAKRWGRYPLPMLFTAKMAEKKALTDWVKTLPEVKELTSGARYVLISEDGQATGVFEARDSLPSEDGERTYQIRWMTYQHRVSPPASPTRARPLHSDCHSEYGSRPLLVLGRPQDSTLVQIVDTLYVPEGTRVLKVAPAPSEREMKETNGPPSVSHYDERDEELDMPLRPGTLVDMQLGIQKSASQLKIFANDYETIVGERHMPLQAAVIHLVRDHGLLEKDARDALQDAKRQHGARFWVKYAEPFELQRSAPSAPAIQDNFVGTDDFFQSGLPTTYPVSYDQPVSGLQYLRPGMTNYASPPDQGMNSSVMQSAQSGQRELLDASLMQSLLKGTQDETVIDRYLGALVKGLDAIGRLYFNFLWHHDLFENRYGSDKLSDMEDSLRNNFDNLGDLVLSLKRTGVDPLPGEQMEEGMEEQAEA